MTRPVKPSPITNRILAALPNKEYRLLLPKLEEVELNYADIIYAQDDVISHVYFPNSGIVSLLVAVEGRHPLEVGITGSEGMVGLPLFMDAKTSNNLALVQGSGSAMRMSAKNFLAECRSENSLPRFLRRYAHLLMAQISQSAACNNFHPVEPRLARWLLMSSDRMKSDEFRLTQEFLSNMLGVRREAVNISLNSLHKQQLINYRRANISIIDRAALEAAACECYGIIRAQEKNFEIN